MVGAQLCAMLFCRTYLPVYGHHICINGNFYLLPELYFLYSSLALSLSYMEK